MDTTINNDNDNQKTRAPFFIYCGLVRVEYGYEGRRFLIGDGWVCYHEK